MAFYSRYPVKQPSTPGYAEQPHLFWKALEGVVQGLRGMQTSQAGQPWGFHEPTVTAGEAMGPMVQGANTMLSDPRNAWMGLGPLVGMARFRRVPNLGRDTGGFNMPTSRMMKLDPGMARSPELSEVERRGDYLFGRSADNSVANAMMDESHPMRQIALERYQNITQADRDILNKTMKGLAELQGEITKQSASPSGGSIPPYWFRPKTKR